MPGWPSGFVQVVRDSIRALKPYGAAPIVVVVLATLGMVGLVLKAPPLAVLSLVLIAFGAFFGAQERSAEWRRRNLRVEYETIERKEATDARKKLERRVQRLRNEEQLLLPDARSSSDGTAD